MPIPLVAGRGGPYGDLGDSGGDWSAMDPQSRRGGPIGVAHADGDTDAPGDTVDHIPWDRLTISAPERPPWVSYLVAGAAAVAIGEEQALVEAMQAAVAELTGQQGG